MRTIVWLFRVAIFLVLFAFALNNQEEASLKLLFGAEWRAPMVFIVLAAFALGCMCGVLAMVPSWWRQRRLARHTPPLDTLTAPVSHEPVHAASSTRLPQYPPRDGL